MRSKLLILFFVLALPMGLDAQLRDSVQLDEVEISVTRKKNLSDGYREQDVSGVVIGSFANRTLGELLLHSSNVNIRSNGSPGASTSVSLRGLGASQTQVNWNGFPVNSVTLGSADVSNVMVSNHNNISIIPGAGGVAYGSGTFGGAINIDYQPSHNQSNIAVIDLSAGSFGSYKAAGSYNANINKLALSGTVYGDRSDADFSYFDEIKQEEFKRVNADYGQYGFEQYFTFTPDAYTVLKGGLLAHVKDLNIPSIEGAALDNIENQKDSTLRLFMDFKKVFNASSLNIKGAWFYTDQHYTKGALVNGSEVTTIDSRIKSKSWFGDVHYRIFLIDHISVEAGATYNNTTGIVDAYGGSETDEVLGLIGGIKFSKKLNANISLRKEWAKSIDSDVLINMGVDYPITNTLNLRGAFSQKFRRPTFNDLYWEPGGNPDLKPENGYSVEAGLNQRLPLGKFGELTTDLSAYYSPIEDMIVWRPEGAVWYAKNYSNVLTRGVDLNLNHKLTSQLSKIHWETSASLAFNKATIEQVKEDNKSREGQPLYYAPEWTSNISSGISTDNQNQFSVNWHFVSQRYYDDSINTLEPYWLIGARVAKTINFKRQQLYTQLSVENVFDKSYKTISSYPMPGRFIELKLKYIIKRKS